MDTKILFNKILQLAIEGKLLSQIEIEGSAKDLIAEIENEKKRQIEQHKIKLSKPEKKFKPIPINEYKLPNNWTWCYLNDVCRVFGRIGFRGYTKSDIVNSKEEGAITISPTNMIEGHADFKDCTYISLEKYEESPEIKVENGDILVVKTASIGKVALIDDLPWKATINPQIAILKDIKINRKYFVYFLLSNFAQEKFKSFTIGTAIPTFSQEKLLSLPIPLPPLQEQQRISTTLEAIKNKLDIYEENQLEISKNADLLKKQLLHQAICGKLVSQNPDEGSADDLIKQIEAEKKRLIEEEYQNAINKAKQEGKSEKEIKKIKKKEYVAPQPISPDDYPFDIPSSWKWVRLGEIGTTNTGSTPPKTNPNYFGNYIPFLSPGNIKNNVIVSYETQGLSEEGYKIARPTPQGTIIQVCIGGSIGKCAITDKEITFNQQINSITPFLVLSKYVFIVLASKWFVDKMLFFTAGSATPIINKSMWEFQYFPLPPLSEQRRIVEKLEELFVEIDKLK